MSGKTELSSNQSYHRNSMAADALIVAGTEMEIMSINQEAVGFLGSYLKHGSTLCIDRFVQNEDCPGIQDAIQETLSKGKSTYHTHARIKTLSGQTVSMLFSTYPLYADHDTILGVVLCFGRSTKQEHLSTGSPEPVSGNPVMMEQKFLMEALPEGVFTINTKWQVASFNKTAEKITGYKKHEVLGRHCWEVFQSDLCELGCPLKNALETGKGGEQQDVRILKKEGGYQTILVNTGVLRDDQGMIAGAIETFRTLAGESGSIKKNNTPPSFSQIIGQSKKIKALFKVLPDVAASDANVFLTGESGTGKELFARSIHTNSSRSRHPFVAVNCSALAESLLESELFGHEKSAFTGATKTKPGRFEVVKQGTLFLDEIGELKPSLQIKLLRVLEQREFERVGGTTPIPLQARIICATNKDLSRALENGSFRKDFYYRLRTVPIVIPPLRERKEDIPLLVDFFINTFNTTFKKNVKSVAQEALDLFLSYHWPGNVRELERTIEHAFVFVKGPVIRLDNLPQLDSFNFKDAQPPVDNSKITLSKKDIVTALTRTGGRKNKAAVSLGISRTSLWRKMKAYDLLA